MHLVTNGKGHTVLNQVTVDAVARLAIRSGTRTEADIQSDIQTVLVAGDLNLDPNDAPALEQQVADGTRRRIDIAICHAVIEAKKDLSVRAILLDAEVQLAGYLKTRQEQNERRYVGILSDGVDWVLYDLDLDDKVVEVAKLKNTGDAERLVVWLEAILVSDKGILPSPTEIENRLGASSPGHSLDFRELSSLYEASKTKPEVALKRELWAKLLKTAFGSSFKDDSDTFINHTLLVLTAEIIAHAVLGINVSATSDIAAKDLLRGKEFDDALIHGVVEADFFDWVADVPGGEGFVRVIADRISRFNWDAVEHDVLKHLYESVISQASRASLGEYYTPDWLADRVVDANVTDPLNQRVLDPSCGSGTFIFHAVRAYLAAAEAAGVPLNEALTGLVTHVLGMDIHPVAVTLARVTYLLAITKARLNDPVRPEIAVPIYLGDTLQWEQNRDLFTHEDAVSVSTSSNELVGEGGGILGDNPLVFPISVLENAVLFDRLVSRMSDKALDNTNKQHGTLITPVFNQLKIAEADRAVLGATFATMRDLARSGRNHIWGYYVRNLIRPIWLALPANKVDVLIGNPPWLRYNKMTSAMKDRYKTLAKPRNLLTGGLGASSRDLSTLFAARAVEMYLNDGGTFAFVMPHGTMTRLPHTGFRSGAWSSSQAGALTVAFGKSWDLTKTPTGFPMVSCVINGRVDSPPVPMPAEVDVWTSTLRTPDTTWDDAAHTFTITGGTVSQMSSNVELPVSPYKKRFRDGAILYPRMLLAVEDAPTGALGAGAGRRRVRSRRSNAEKVPWKNLDSITESVETDHIYPIHLGETVVPYRALDPLHAVLPLGSDRLLTASQIAENPGLSSWWDRAETVWEKNRVDSETADLLTRIDYHAQLSSQVPTAAHRVVYTKSGTTLAAARIEDPRAIIDHVLYWSPVETVAEGRYLTGILNSATLLSRVTPLQSLGLFGPRHFDKNVFYVNFGPYEHDNPHHTTLISLVEQAEAIAEQATVASSFKTTRANVRRALTSAGLAQQIEDAVNNILPVIVP